MLRLLDRHGDVLLAVGVVAAVAIIVVPLPTSLVDILLALSLSGAVVLLLTATWVRHPLRFSSLPAILLLSTLFRLALNVSTTRLILSQADAGAVIESFGAFVVGGNYVVGAVIFVIITVIQYVVIAKGSERVAEVAARFTLDALPGRQLAIDADLRSGALTQAEGRAQRAALQRESRLYGALDGAMKFVKGDAIAGVVITLVNIVAGLSIGVLQQGLPLAEAARLYTLLTVGDGLAAQIPAILIATTAGVVVTQVADEGDGGHLARDIGRQVTAYPRALAVTAALLTVFALLPGLPAVPFGVLGVFLGLVAWGLRKRRDETSDAPRTTAPRLVLWASPDVHAGLIAAQPALAEALAEGASELANVWGIRAPLVVVAPRPARELSGRAWRLELDGATLERGELATGEGSGADVARLASDAIVGAIRAHLDALMGIQWLAERVQRLRLEQPALVEAGVPERLGLSGLTELLRRLLAEGVSVADLPGILEVVAREERAGGEIDELVERVRQGLSRQIAHRFSDARGLVRALVVDPGVEEMVRTGVRATPRGPRLALERDVSAAIVEAAAAARAEHGEDLPFVTQSDVRPHVRRLLAMTLPTATVLSYDELTAAPSVEAVGRVVVGRR